MIEDTALFALLLASVALGVLLLLTSGAAFGRILADLEYQYAAGLNGVRRIQSWVNLRTHGNRIILGLFALTTGVLALTDSTLLWRTWTARALFLVVLVGYTVSSVLDWIDQRRQVRILLKEHPESPAMATLLLHAVSLGRDMGHTVANAIQPAISTLDAIAHDDNVSPDRRADASAAIESLDAMMAHVRDVHQAVKSLEPHP